MYNTKMSVFVVMNGGIVRAVCQDPKLARDYKAKNPHFHIQESTVEFIELGRLR